MGILSKISSAGRGPKRRARAPAHAEERVLKRTKEYVDVPVFQSWVPFMCPLFQSWREIMEDIVEVVQSYHKSPCTEKQIVDVPVLHVRE